MLPLAVTLDHAVLDSGTKTLHNMNLNENLLLRESMHDNIQLMMDGYSDRWVSKVLLSLVKIGAIT